MTALSLKDPLKVFYSYSHKDENLRDKLEKHLALLKRQGVISGWHDRRISAGSEWKGQIDEHLNQAVLILLLVSSDFLFSEYCYDIEMKRALERHDAGEARVIPIILRPVDWTSAPFARLQALPKDGKPVTEWSNRDRAFLNIAEGIRQAVGEFKTERSPHRLPQAPTRTADQSGHEGIQAASAQKTTEDCSDDEEPVLPARMSAHYFAAQREIIEKHVRCFVGRDSVRQALENFVASHRRGYFIVRGGPGQGKTAIACSLVKTRQFVHHFVSRMGGRSDLRLILRSLLGQLLQRGRTPFSMPETIPELTKYLEDCLARLAAQKQQTVLVIDALDELSTEVGPDLPFLVTDGLPEGVYVVVTSRPGDRLDRLVELLSTVPRQTYDLEALELAEMDRILRAHRPNLTLGELERIAEASQGNPLYLHAIAEELEKDTGFDLRDLPMDIESFYRRSTRMIRASAKGLLHDVLGLLSVARKPLSRRELAQITGRKQRQIDKEGIQPIRQFLLELDDGCSFYHARFHDFVVRELLYEDELPDYHGLLASWLQRPENHSLNYRWNSLTHHLFSSGEREGLRQVIDSRFLADKVRRFGYAVLEDVELLACSLLQAGDPALVPHCVSLVEGLREVVGGDVIEDTRWILQGYRAGLPSFRSRILEPALPSIPGIDVYVGSLPKVQVGADFFEVLSIQDRLVLAIGDAPGKGLKSAFIARFLGNLFRQLVEASNRPNLGGLLGEMNRLLLAHDYFPPLSMQCADVDLTRRILTVASAGHPYPVLFSAHQKKCDRLPVWGDLLGAPPTNSTPQPSYEQRQVEIGPGDVLVLVTDGLTESQQLTGDRFGYRFMGLVERAAGRNAKAIGEIILDAWRAHPREEDYVDDVTVMVVAMATRHSTPEMPRAGCEDRK